MTEATLRKNVATWLDQYKGIKEGSAEHKQILQYFNDSGLCGRYKMTVDDPWCAAAVSAAFIANSAADIFPCVECSCDQMIALAKTAGIWMEDDSHVPDIGDVILYDWQDSGTGDNTGSADHVGIVQSVGGTTITVIEGNKSNTVGTRQIEVNGKYIRGYILPLYSMATGSGSALKSVSEVAQEVIAGKWGNDPDRAAALTAAGYDAAAVQSKVNELLGVGSNSSSSSSSKSSDTAGTSLKAAQSFESGYSKGKSYKVTATSGLNMRYGPGTGYGIITALANGAKVTYYGYFDVDSTGTKWLLVISNGITGWVCSTYLG